MAFTKWDTLKYRKNLQQYLRSLGLARPFFHLDNTRSTGSVRSSLDNVLLNLNKKVYFLNVLCKKQGSVVRENEAVIENGISSIKCDARNDGNVV